MADKTNNVVGTNAGSDAYEFYRSSLKWILETQKKLPDITQSAREEAFKVDPLIRGIIVPFLRNYLLTSGHIETADNKKFKAAIDEIEKYHTDLKTLDAFRDDFEKFYVTVGHSYRRMDRDDKGIVSYLAPLGGSPITTYTDAWVDSIKAYHQKSFINTSWSSTGALSEYNSWWIPGVKEGAQWIKDGVVKDTGVYEKFAECKSKYGITDTIGLRIGSSADILAMNNVQKDAPAPIDSIVLAIWLKRLLLVQSPNIIYRVLSPLIHMKQGLVVETTDADGSKVLTTTVPQEPAPELQVSNPELYNQMAAEYAAYGKSVEKNAKTLLKCLVDGGIFASDPDIELNVIESGRNLTHQFVRESIAQLNEEIGQALGFPVALITATGSELASSRTIESTLNKTLKGIKGTYERMFDFLTEQAFKDRTWDGYTFADIRAHYKLDTPDTKDLLAEAQTQLAQADKLVKIASIGASKADIQALADEVGFGMLSLDGYGTVQPTATPIPVAGIQSSAVDLQPSDADEEKLKNELLASYKDMLKALQKDIMAEA